MSSEPDFWSRRRAAVAAEESAQKQAEAREAEVAEVEATRAELEELPEAELLAKLDLPDPDTLKPGDDFTAFLRDVVPEHLRRRALRRLWRSNPVLANLDGLNDYDTDYTNAATDAPGLKTAYRVGRGLLKHIEALAAAEPASDAAAQADAELDSETIPGSSSEPTIQSAVRPPTQELASVEIEQDGIAENPLEASDSVAENPEEGDAQSLQPSRRRITFSFNG